MGTFWGGGLELFYGLDLCGSHTVYSHVKIYQLVAVR